MADSFELTTAKAAGETITMAIGCAKPSLTITWEDGSTKSVTTKGLPIDIELQSSTFSVSSTGDILYIYAPDAELTSISLDDMTNLQQLIVPNNQLTSLSLNTLDALEVLDVQNNSLTTLTTVRYCTNLVSLNCAYNQLSALSVGSQSYLTTLICAGNQLTNLTLTTAPNLETLWCQDNSLTRLSLANNTALRKLYAFNNSLTSVTVPASLTEIWVDQNALTELDLESATGLKEIVVDHNQLNLIEMSSSNSSTLKYFYAHENALSFNSFPTVSSLTDYALSPQDPFDLGISPEVGVEFNIRDYFYQNAWGRTTGAFSSNRFTWYDASTDEALEKDVDYSAGTTGRFTFLKAFPQGVYGTATTSLYDDPIQTATVTVVTPTGISDVTTDNGLCISTSSRTLTVESPSATQIKVYNTAGSLMVNSNISAGTHSWTLPQGVYIVNGKKVLVP